MPQISVEGCVLRAMDFKDADRIYSLLTPTHGRLDMVARGARKSQKRFGGHLELFGRVQCEVQYREGRDLHSLTAVQQVAALPGIREDVLRFAVASYGAEWMLRTAVTDLADPDAYKLLLAWLDRVARAPSGWEEAILRAGQVRMLANRGVLAPQLQPRRSGSTAPMWKLRYKGLSAG